MQLRPRASAGNRSRSEAGTCTVMHQHSTSPTASGAPGGHGARAACTPHWLPFPHSGQHDGSTEGGDAARDMAGIVRAPLGPLQRFLESRANFR